MTRTLCLVTDRSFTSASRFLDAIDEAIAGGVNMVQFREKRDPLSGMPLTDREIYELGLSVRGLCLSRSVPFIVNDRFDLAMALDADGVHLGQSDLPIQAARRIWDKGAVFGASVRSLEEAQAAVAAGATYVGYGAVFPTTSKADAVHTGLEKLGEVVRGTSVPVIAIGGIAIANAPSVVASGCAGIAVISAILGSPSPEAAARSLSRLLAAQ